MQAYNSLETALTLTERLIDVLNPAFGPFVREDARATLENIQASGTLIVRPHGLIGGSIGSSPINRTRKIAYERVFYAEKGFRGLIKEFENWAAKNGAEAVVISCFSLRVAKIYGALGYERAESYYIKDL